MKIALAGLTASGKTTLFNAVTGQHVASGFSAGKPTVHLGQVKVPDERVEGIARIVKPRKLTHATIDLVDIPGSGRGADAMKGNAAILNEMRDSDGLVLVVRAFESASVQHPLKTIDPHRDLMELTSDFAVADLDQLEKRVAKLRVSIAKPTPKQAQEKRELALLEKLLEHAEEAESLIGAHLSEEEERLISSFSFLTRKPTLVILNCSEDQLADPPKLHTELPVLAVSAEVESEIADLEEQDRAEFLKEIGLEEPAVARFIRATYEMTGAITFFTAGEQETRAWTIERGSTAIEAAGKIHSDIARGFIRAEVYKAEDLIEAGDTKTLKTEGKQLLHGKEYVVQDGDVLHIRFNI